MRGLVATGCLLLVVFMAFHWTNWDLAIQDCLYTPGHSWLIDKDESVKNWIFYSGPKVALGLFGGACLFAALLSLRYERLRPYRRSAILMCLSMIVVPSSVTLIKHVSNVYTPNQVRRYGGNHNYRKPFEWNRPLKDPDKPGRGFPASHASGGFALMMLYFALCDKRARQLGLFLGITAGWIMGMYQTLNGQHFFSHTPVTMLWAWLIIQAICHVWKDNKCEPLTIRSD